MTKLKVGIVGCGEAAQVVHLPAPHCLSVQFAVTALRDVSSTVLEGACSGLAATT